MLRSIIKQLFKPNNKKILLQHKYNESEHSVEIDGIKLFLDKNDSLSLHLRPYEPVLLEWVKNHIMPGDIIVDIGANIGYYTMMLAKAVGSTGRVYAFEPEPNNFNLIQKNMMANHFTNVFPVNAAVGKENGVLKLYMSKPEWNGSNGMHRTYPSIFCEKNSIDVIAVKLDSFFSVLLKGDMLNKISFVKIDAEGAELDILYGMSSILRNGRLSMLVEYGPACVREKGDNPYLTIDILKNNGFKFNYERGGTVKPVDNLKSYVDFLNNSNLTDENVKVANFLLEKETNIYV